MSLKALRAIRVEVGEYTAFVENGKVSQKISALLNTEEGIREFGEFLDEVREAMRVTARLEVYIEFLQKGLETKRRTGR